MRIVLATFGTDGDTRPMLALAQGLVEGGHEAVVLGDRSGQRLASAVGVEFHALAGDVRAMMRGGGPVGSTMRTGRPHPRTMHEIARRHTLDWHRAIDAAAEGADAVVGSSLAVFVALSVAEGRRVPGVAAALQPYAETVEFPPPLSGFVGTPLMLNLALHRAVHTALWWSARGPLNDARATLGLPTRAHLWDDFPALFGFSPTLVSPPADWDARSIVTGDWPLTVPDPHVPDGLVDFLGSGDPPVYLGFGSMAGIDNNRLHGTLLDGLDGRRAVVVGGWGGLTRSLPPHVYAADHVEHNWLFPRCAAVVHHAGAGTSHAAVRWGVPSVPIPQVADQPFWADRLFQLGVASRPLSRHRLSGGGFRAALSDALNPEVRHRAAELSAGLRREGGVARAVAELERIVGKRSSQW